MDIRARATRVVCSGLSATAISLVMSASAFAAANLVVPCEQVTRDLKSLTVPVDKLTVDNIDHVPVDADGIEALADDIEPLITDFEAPILLLTPRVTNILRDVFGAVTELATPEKREQEASSPLADRDATTETTLAPVDGERDDNILPLYQRHMYRKDI